MARRMHRKRSPKQKELYGPDRTQPDPLLNLFEPFKAYIPKGMMAKLREESAERSIPVGRLISFAIYKELERGEIFSMNLRLPVNITPDIPEKSQRVFSFIRDMRAVSVDMLVMCQDEVGLSREEILGCVRYLLNIQAIEHDARGKWTGLVVLAVPDTARLRAKAELEGEEPPPPPPPKHKLKV